MDSWEDCEVWMKEIKEHRVPSWRTNIVLTHNGFYYADSDEAKNASNQITEADYHRVIRKGARDVVDLFERSHRYSNKCVGSYSGKHLLEHYKDYYMTNGEFILAVLCSGLVAKAPYYWSDVAKGLTGNKSKISLNIAFPMKLKKVRY